MQGVEGLFDYKVFRAGTSVAHAVASGATDARTHVSLTIANTIGITDTGTKTPSTNLIDVAIRSLENNDAEKLTEFLKASPGIATQPLRPAYIAVTHPDLRQDIESLPTISAELIPILQIVWKVRSDGVRRNRSHHSGHSVCGCVQACCF